ncbi:MAG: hypothetical protein IH945_03600 [Armatimonadetes bacterium]|nr:hypothetical protein [Armatimonadota bacterium]
MNDPGGISHEEFLAGYRAGRIGFNFQTGAAFDLRVGVARKWEKWVLILLPLLFSALPISIASVVLSIIIGNYWLLLAVPAAWIGMASNSASQYRGSQVLSCLPTLGAAGSMIYGLFTEGWTSTFFFIACAFFVPYVCMSVLYRIGKRGFVRHFLESEQFYNAALKHRSASIEFHDELPHSSAQDD